MEEVESRRPVVWSHFKPAVPTAFLVNSLEQQSVVKQAD